MKPAPKVSVSTCSHNRPDFLRLAVESLRAQTDPDWEHLIWDEKSTDPRVREVLAWAGEDDRVRVWFGTENRDRPAAVWNFLHGQARGRYLTTMDDDNEKLPRFVEVMSRTLDCDPDLGLVTCGLLVRTAGEPDWEHHHNLRTVEDSKFTSTCEGGALLYRREVFEAVGPFSEEIRTNEDWEWLRRAVLAGVRVKNLTECLTVYRQHDGQRQRRAESLGHSVDVAKILGSQLATTDLTMRCRGEQGRR